ncbi:DUF4019 domain-containing protein [Pseudoduganella sp. R-34]|uniref:DUF4019 domain-containing protein n=1 Tax=unclassified Pseudoduganella TaxID=2637179 RepID=UPI003CF89B81
MRAVLLIAGLLLSGAVFAQDAPSGDSAKTAASEWLALTDAGSYGASWDKAAPAFKGAISKPGWEQALRNVRMPLGTVKSRRLASAQFTHSLPGAPAGDYFVLQFATQFENKASAVETVTPMKGPDGNWRVSGYFIK